MRNLIVKNSKIHGKGVFANRDFKKGETVLYFTGDLYDVKDYPFLLNDPSYDAENDRFIQVSETMLLGPYRDNRDPNFEEPDNWVNHSCNPNCLIRSEGKLGLKLFVRRDIRKGEEITFDFSTAIILDSWSIECKCGGANCRGRITEFRLLPLDLQEQYVKEGGVPKFFLKILGL